MYTDGDPNKGSRSRRGAVEGFKSPFVPGVPYQPYLAIADLELLHHLVGGTEARRNMDGFKLKLFQVSAFSFWCNFLLLKNPSLPIYYDPHFEESFNLVHTNR